MATTALFLMIAAAPALGFSVGPDDYVERPDIDIVNTATFAAACTNSTKGAVCIVPGKLLAPHVMMDITEGNKANAFYWNFSSAAGLETQAFEYYVTAPTMTSFIHLRRCNSTHTSQIVTNPTSGISYK